MLFRLHPAVVWASVNWDTFNLSRMDADDDRHRNVAEDAEFEASGFEFEDAPEDAGADVDVDFDDE